MDTNMRMARVRHAAGQYRRYVRLPADNERPGRHGSYGSLLFDPRWREKRAAVLERDGYKCAVCGGTEDLHVHHRQYHYRLDLGKFSAPWEYEDRLLLTICSSCHQRGHNLYKVPIVYI